MGSRLDEIRVAARDESFSADLAFVPVVNTPSLTASDVPCGSPIQPDAGDAHQRVNVTGATGEVALPKRLGRMVFVSRVFPSDFEGAVFGIFQRLRVFLEAAAAITDRLDLLFFVEPSYIERFDAASFALELKRRWGISAIVHFALREDQRRSWLNKNLRPLWQVSSHPAVVKTGGKTQVRAVESLLLQDADLIIAFQFESALPVLGIDGQKVPFVFDINDVEHIAYPRMLARPPLTLGKILRYEYWPALYFAERRAVKASATAFVCSNVAAAAVARMAPEACIRVAPNAVKFPAEQLLTRTVESSASTTLLFVGLYAYAPNVEGAELLARHIFPLVRARVPDATLVFVGQYIEKIAHLAGPGIELKGFVDDLAAEYAGAAIACCPILAGGGTRTKILEAAAHRVPVIATTLGAEGIEFRDGVEIVLRDQPTAFAAACVELLADPAARMRIAEAAYERARIYDRDRVVAQLANDLRMAADPARGSSAAG